MTKAELRKHIAALRPLLVPGAVFDTDFEQGCTVVSAPDDEHLANDLGDTGFVGLDSEGVECRFSIVMVGNLR